MKAAWKRFWILSLLVTSMPCLSAPLRNFPRTLRQPDGTILHCFATGDEFYNRLHDAADFTIIQDTTSGFFVYAALTKTGLVPTSYIPGRDDPETVGLVRGVRLPRAIVDARREQHLTDGSTGMRLRIARAPRKGVINNIVIFIRFSGEGDFCGPPAAYRAIFNGEGSPNSVYTYFKEVSYSTLEISSTLLPVPDDTLIASFEDSHPRSYYMPFGPTNPDGYTGGDDGSERTKREHTLLKNAVSAVASEVPVDLKLDGDGDGRVDNVTFIVKGGTEGWGSLLWPHMWVLYTASATLNGKAVWTYNFQIEDALASSGVGVLCHEMFHSLGAPDLYHYSHDGLEPVFKWDLMEYDLNPPQHMGAYMKHRYGEWIARIDTISASGTYGLSPLTSATANSYIIRSPVSIREYYLLEYRKRTSVFESSIPGEGLLVYRINTARDGAGNAGGAPDEVYVYRPGGTLLSNGSPDRANFSAKVSRTALTDAMNPPGFLSDGNPGGLSISGIGMPGATITFTVVIGAPMVVTGGSIVLDAASTVVGGSVNPLGDSTVYRFEYGPTLTYGSQTPAHGAGTGSGAVLVSDSLRGLAPMTPYHYRIVASNARGESQGADSIFLTLPGPPPAVSLLSPVHGATIDADSVTFAWRTVTGDVDCYALELGTDSTFHNSAVDSAISDTSFVMRQLDAPMVYWWRVRAKNPVGWGPASEIWAFRTSMVNSGESPEEIPAEFSLLQNYPNPFNPSTTIEYTLPRDGDVVIELYDALGRRVGELVHARMAPGRHRVTLNNAGLASGAYFYRMLAGQFRSTRLMLIMR